MNDWAGASQLVLFTTFASQSSGLYQLTGMARVEQTNQNLEPFTLIGYGDSRFNNLEFWTDGTFHYEDGHGNWVSSGVAYQSGQWYSFNYLIDMDSDRWSFDIHDSFGNDVLSASNLHFGTNLYTAYFNLLRSWGVGDYYTGVWYIDDEHLQQIPEPSTLALLGTGMASLLFTAWRQRKRK
jgi:hypothetical protein